MHTLVLSLALLLLYLDAAGCSRRGTDDLLDRLARLSVLDMTFAYDPVSDRLVFAHTAGEPGLFVIDGGDRRTLRRLTPRVSWPRRIALAAGGRALVYHERVQEGAPSDGVFWMSLPDGTTRPLVRADDSDAIERTLLSPDGTQLVYERVRKEEQATTRELRLLGLEGHGDRPLLSAAEGEAEAPTWSRDGVEVYYLAGPCLKVVTVKSGATRTLACITGARSIKGLPDPPLLSPDGRLLAFTVELADCPRLVVVEVAGGAWRYLDPTECGMRPTWVPGPSPTLAYISPVLTNASRAPRLRVLDEPRSRSLGFDLGVTYQVTARRDGSVIALLSTPELPRSLWQIDPRTGARKMLFSPIEPAFYDRLSRSARVPFSVRVSSKDGLSVPLLVFPPAPRKGRDRGPTLLYLHGGEQGREDISPRWDETIQSFALAGATVVAVNYRGSTGYGASYRDQSDDETGKVEDIRAALRYLPSLPWVDPQRIYLFAVSYSGVLGARVAEAEPGRLRGAVQWLQSAKPWLKVTAPPPLLWVSGTWERGTAGDPAIADQLRHRGVALTWGPFPDGHMLRLSDNRARAYALVRQFIGD